MTLKMILPTLIAKCVKPQNTKNKDEKDEVISDEMRWQTHHNKTLSVCKLERNQVNLIAPGCHLH